MRRDVKATAGGVRRLLEYDIQRHGMQNETGLEGRAEICSQKKKRIRITVTV